ncbi:MAG TPA: hypothetical protein VND94_00985 [Terriglobia bacterium]|nr:hypothetical protein [Terriglobia bacterium]
MSPETAISMLDGQLRQHGEDVILRRPAGTQQIPLEVACRAMVSGYQPAELLGGIVQGDTKVILSPTEMVGRQWPWPPRRNDKCIIGGAVKNIEAVDAVSMNNRLVRINLQVRG